MLSQKEESEATGTLLWQEEFRAEFPLLQEVTFFQTGSLAPLANCVRTAMTEAMDAEGVSGLRGYASSQSLQEEAENCRRHLAAFLGVMSEELGWTTNTTLAIRHAVDTIDWQPEDVLIQSSTEHICTRQMCAGLAERYGIRIPVVPVESGNQRFLETLDAILTKESRVRLLILSHVSCLDGRRLPVAEATQLAHERGVRVLIDGAQSVGQFPVNVSQIGCDFYVGSAHKWLLGPAGLGYLYVAQEQLDRFHPRFLVAPHTARQNGHTATLAAAMETGTQSMVHKAGLDAALAMLEQASVSAIEAHVAHLSSHLRAGLRDMQGIKVLTPAEEAGSGITTFTLLRSSLDEVQRVVNGLWDRMQMVVKVQRDFPAVRVSIAAFNTIGDVNRLLEGLCTLVET